MPETNAGFQRFKLNSQILQAVDEAGYVSPTPIQAKAIPGILAGQDVLGIAQTGTGKTAAYALPLLMKIKYAQEGGPRAIILAPTRELVLQIHEVIASLGKYLHLRIIALFGGIGPKAQRESLANGVDIVVSTPGRFLDFYGLGEIDVKKFNTLVLDEADKMMDMGFMPQIRRILEVIPVKRQNLLFSATFPEKVERLSYEFLEFPTRYEITPQATTAESVDQLIYEVPNLRTKLALLSELIKDVEHAPRVMVFVRSRESANAIYRFLVRKVIEEEKIRVIHANKGQNTRINAMEAFKQGNVHVLVTTDVTARGIDVEEVSDVINFDVPIIYEDYVHRIGRTGRANRKGRAITFMTEADRYHILKIEKIIKQSIPKFPLPKEVEIFPTPKEEEIAMLREIDDQKKREDPKFKGAFHEKKKQFRRKPVKSNKPGTKQKQYKR